MAMTKKQKGVMDFVLMDKVEEKEFMKNLEVRFKDDTIYTRIGNVVVSMNPYRKLDIYSNDVIEMYRARFVYELPPHIFAVAGDAYRDMHANKREQCIIISGESGAGKTEASKTIMQYIAAVAGKGRDKIEKVKNQLLQSNPVLEAFGNACTNRNDNSSRFGKYMDIQFDFTGDPVGGKISNYLLEKARVIHQAQGERNFHIFYQVFGSGLISGDSKDYQYLNQSSVAKVKTIDDSKDFKEVKKALKVIGFADEDVNSMWKVVCGIIMLGNVKFKESGVDRSSVENMDVLKKCASLFGIDEKVLSTSLTERTVAAQGNSVKSHATVQQAVYARDAFAKSVYDRLFSWLVGKINERIHFEAGPGEDTTVIGVLDIYGFEIFEVNGFEQFCINYCNEKLQQLFIELTLKAEQEEYEREGIQWEHIDYFDNSKICALIDAKQSGMIAILDEECLRPGATNDLTYLEKLEAQLSGHDRFETRKTVKNDKTMTDGEFRLKHYAGDVKYKVENFMDKNTDNLFKDLKAAAFSSSLPCLKSMFQDGSSINQASKRPITAGTSFKNSLGELVANLMTKNPHYIRCIKPNLKKTAGMFDADLVKHQVGYLGLLENVRVRRAGFAYRQEYGAWLNRYKMISKKTWPNYKGSDKDGVEKLCKEMKLGKDDYRMGKTKVFIRSPKTLFAFEEAREATFPRMATYIQKMFRGHRARLQWARLRATIKIQLKWKSYKSKKYHKQLIKTFKDVKTMPDYGKNVPFPKHPSVLQRFSELIRKIHRQWRANMMVKSLSPAQLKDMRLKVFAYNLFHGQKRWQFSRPYEGDYISKMEVESVTYKKVLPKLTGGETVVFSSMVTKVSSKGKPQVRALILTNKSIYKCDPKSFKVTKGAIALSTLGDISVTNKHDHAVVIADPNAQVDMIFDLGFGGEDRVTEFVIMYIKTAEAATGKRPNLKFASPIDIHLAKKNLTLTFAQDPKVQEGSVGMKKKSNSLEMLVHEF